MHELMFESSLRRDERILWTGQPDYRRIFDTSDIAMVPFSLVFCGFSLFWESLVLGIGRTSNGWPVFSIFALFGLPFVMVGMYLLVGRFFYKRWARQRTYYAVTTSRVLIVRETLSSSTEMIYLNAIPTLATSARADGSGSIILHPDTSQGQSRTPVPFALQDIPDVHKVEGIIDDARNAALELRAAA